MDPLGFLLDRLRELGGLGLGGLLFPEPVGEGSDLKFIAPPGTPLPPEGGQCPKRYRVYAQVTSSNQSIRRNERVQIGSPTGPIDLAITFRKIQGGLIVETQGTANMLIDQLDDNPGGPGLVWTQGGASAVGKGRDGATRVTVSYNLEYQTFDGSPDNCGTRLPPPETGVSGAFVPAPLPVPVLPPPLREPRSPFPRYFPDPLVPTNPPAPPINPTPVAPPATPPAPTFNIDIDVLEINIEQGKAFDWTPFFLALAGQQWLLFLQLWSHGAKLDQALKHLECLSEKFCLEYREGIMVGLFAAGFDRWSSGPLRLEGRPEWIAKIVQVNFPNPKPALGRRLRPRVNPLFSDPSFGFLAFQLKTGGYAPKQIINYATSAFPVPDDAIGVAVWIEPSAGEGRVNCWFERFVKEVE